MGRYVLGIDVGGTNIKFGLVNRSGTIFARSHLSTKTFSRTQKSLIKAILEASRDLLRSAKLTIKDLQGAGIGLPGLIDPLKGIVRVLPNIPGWKNVPLKKMIQDDLCVATHIDNDVNLITLGEWKFGAGIGARNLVCVTFGTGVGSGLILNGRLYRGEGFVAGEIGHIPFHLDRFSFRAEKFTRFEELVGNKRLQKDAAKIFRKNNITLEEVSNLAAKGNRQAIQFWQRTGTVIGTVLSGVVNILNPTRLVIGGGVAAGHECFFQAIQRTVKARSMKIHADMIQIVKGKLGNDAGIIGAWELVKEYR